MHHPIVSLGEKKRTWEEKPAASELFHLGENIKRKSSKAVLLHSQCVAPPVTQAILVFFQLCSPALPWHTGPDLLGKNCLERVHLRGSFNELIYKLQGAALGYRLKVYEGGSRELL